MVRASFPVLIAAVWAAAALSCGGSKAEPVKVDPATRPGDATARLVLSLEILPASGPGEIDAGGLVQITVVETDHNGATTRVDLLEVPGPCTDVSAARRKDPMGALLSVDCTGGEGLRL